MRNVGTFGVDANGKATSGLNHEGERTDATPRDGAPRSSEEVRESGFLRKADAAVRSRIRW
jgi:hypothetical protein